MTDKVRSLYGGPFTAPGEPNKPTIELLEHYLEMARSGEIRGALVVAAHADSKASADWQGALTYAALGIAGCIKSEIEAEFRSGDE